MAEISSAIAVAGSPANLALGVSGTILVYREDRMPPDVIRLVPPIPNEDAEALGAKIKAGEGYPTLGIEPTDVVEQPPERSRWFMRR